MLPTPRIVSVLLLVSLSQNLDLFVHDHKTSLNRTDKLFCFDSKSALNAPSDFPPFFAMADKSQGQEYDYLYKGESRGELFTVARQMICRLLFSQLVLHARSRPDRRLWSRKE